MKREVVGVSPAAAVVLAATGGVMVLGKDDGARGLTFESSIPLGDVFGRIDHLSADPAGNVLFVAELANGSVSKIDLTSGTVVARATRQAEPQGIHFLTSNQTLYVAMGGDSRLRPFSIPDLQAGPDIAMVWMPTTFTPTPLKR